MKSQIKSLIVEVNTLKLHNATFEERFQRLLDRDEQTSKKIEETNKRIEETNKKIDQLISWSFGWKTTLLLILSGVILNAFLIPLEKYFHIFGL